MNTDRIAGSIKQAKGTLEEAAGKLVGDAKLKADGKVDQLAGKAQNALGSLADSLKRDRP